MSNQLKRALSVLLVARLMLISASRYARPAAPRAPAPRVPPTSPELSRELRDTRGLTVEQGHPGDVRESSADVPSFGDDTYDDYETAAAAAANATCEPPSYDADVTPSHVCVLAAFYASKPGYVQFSTAFQLALNVFATVGHALYWKLNGVKDWAEHVQVYCYSEGPLDMVGVLQHSPVTTAKLLTVTQGWFDKVNDDESYLAWSYDGGFVVTWDDVEWGTGFMGMGTQLCSPNPQTIVSFGFPGSTTGLKRFPDLRDAVPEGLLRQLSFAENYRCGNTPALDISIFPHCSGSSGSPIITAGPHVIGIYQSVDQSCRYYATKLTREGSSNGNGKLKGVQGGMHLDAFKVHIGDVNFDNMQANY
jgi:hypothetical protein